MVRRVMRYDAQQSSGRECKSTNSPGCQRTRMVAGASDGQASVW